MRLWDSVVGAECEEAEGAAAAAAACLLAVCLLLRGHQLFVAGVVAANA